MSARKNEGSGGFRKKSLTEQAFQLIKDRVISARYVPGQFLQEASICTELKIGRTPVHQALHRLHQEALVEIIPRKGILVRAESLPEVLTALEVRALIEPYCARQCAEKASTRDVVELKEIVARFAKFRAGGDTHHLMELDRHFHARIAQIAGNPLIVDILRPIHERMSRLWFMRRWQLEDFTLTDTEHSDLLNAIEKGAAEEAARAMRNHIESVRRRLMPPPA
jgi:GntR family transcriptional regulator, rspAB operon transcriptional repressor